MVMISDRALYWLVVGVLAAVVGDSFVAGHQNWVACLDAGSLRVSQELTGRVMDIVGRANTGLGRSNEQSQVAIARVQARVDAIQTRVAMRQAEIARRQAERVRVTAVRTAMRHLDCSAPEVTVEVADPDVDSPDAE